MPTTIQPSWVWVKKENSATIRRSVVRTSTMASGLSKSINSSVLSPVLDAGVLGLEPTGFRVGRSSEVNQAGELYWYFAGVVGSASVVGDYTGDGHFRSVRGLGLFPQWAFSVAPQTAAVQGFAARTTGTELSVADTGLGGSAGILPVPDGFELDGGPGRINRSGDEHAYVALGGVSLLPDGGLLGAPELFLMDAGTPGMDAGTGTDGGTVETDGGPVRGPLRHQVGCACS